jgi:hypothetical protein
MPRAPRALLVIATIVAALSPVTAGSAAAAGGSALVDEANDYRYDAGRGPVSLHATVDQIAVERGRQIAAAGELGHDFDYIMRRFDQLNVCWEGFGEIVAYNGSGEASWFMEQWYNSTTHRNIMLGGYTHAGGSREQVGSRWYGVMIFVDLCGATTPPPTASGFTDLGRSIFDEDIEWLVEAGITGGCGPTTFCPRAATSRAQMASFLKRSIGLPAARADWYWDDGASPHEDDINRVSDASISGGCAAGQYCPSTSVTRGQMASFLARALALPATSNDYFGDDAGTMHEDSINRLAAAGIASGCAAGSFCPARNVSREQMAAFLHRAFGD